MRYLLFMVLVIFFGGNLMGQVVLKGKVMYGGTEMAVVGAIITEGYTKNSTLSNINGEFSLNLIENKDSIIISSVGQEKLIISLKELNSFEFNVFKLWPDENKIPNYGITVPVIVLDNPIIYDNKIGAITTLKLKDLNLDNQTQITPALNRVPGVFMHSGALNTNRITIRGIGNRSPFATAKIKAYLDEIPLTTGIGETTIEDIDLSILDGVNVLKGPTASVYGAGLGGMLGLYTDTKTGGGNFVSTKMTVGSYGLIRNATDLKFGKNSKYKLHFNFNNTHSDGYRDNNEYDRTGYTMLGSITPNYKNKLTFIANFTKLKAFIPSSLNQNDFDNVPTKAAFTWGSVMGFEDYDKTLVGLSYRSFMTDWLKNTTSIFATTYESYESRPFNILQEERLTLGGRTVFDFETRPNFVPDFRIGAEYFHENYDWQTYRTNDGVIGDLLSNNAETRIFYNLFAQAQWNIENHTQIKAGINFNETNYDLEDRFNQDSLSRSGDYSFDNIASPSLAINHNLTRSLGLSNINIAIYGVVSHGFSPPSLEETLTPDGQINPEIQPEKGWNFELGTRGNWKKLRWNISGYSMRIEDLLVARRTDFDQFVGINAGKTTHNGLEAELRYSKNIGDMELNVFANYSYSDYKFEEFVDGDDDYSGNKLTGTAPHIASFGIDSKLPLNFYANINYQFVDAMPMRDDNSIFSESWQVMNLKVGWERTFAKKWKLDVFAGINNFLDEKYASMILINAGSFGGNAPRYYYPSLPRNYYGGIRLKYLF